MLRRTLLALVATVLAAAAFVVPAPAVAAAPGALAGLHQPCVPADGYAPPVDAPVSDPFRPPAGPYGRGNRGLTYDLPPGTTVRAAGDGTVVFAGAVGGSLHVTVLHADGLRTSYSFLESVAVKRGEAVAVGAAVGTAGRGFHFGVRDGRAYLDPAVLFGAPAAEVRLIPADEVLPPHDAGLRREGRAFAAAIRWAAREAREVASLGARTAAQAWDASPLAQVLDLHDRLVVAARSPCTPVDAPRPAPPVERRIALLVAGFGSTSDEGAIDDLATEELGYADGDTLRFSYRGGRIPDLPDRDDEDGWLERIPASAYDGHDAQGDLHDQGGRLADLIEQVWALEPGVPVDLYAHSQGGVVVRLALLELERRARGTGDLGVVVTFGTPHDGADAATAAGWLGPTGRTVLGSLADLWGHPLDPEAPALAQLGEHSDVVAELEREGVPDGVELRTVAARGDLLVPANHASVPGQPTAVVGLSGIHAHDELPGSRAALEEAGLALAGMPPLCRSFRDLVLDHTVPLAISATEDLLGLAAGAVLPR